MFDSIYGSEPPRPLLLNARTAFQLFSEVPSHVPRVPRTSGREVHQQLTNTVPLTLGFPSVYLHRQRPETEPQEQQVSAALSTQPLRECICKNPNPPNPATKNGPVWIQVT